MSISNQIDTISMTKKIKCLITAGPTREHFDPVRFISNPSTGKMGWNIALAAQKKGWDTTLVLGPSELPNIDGVNVVRVVSAQDMLEACQKYFDDCNILIMSAAVSDVRPATKIEHKAKKDEIDLCPKLERTPDILKTLSKNKGDKILVGFAAETHDVLNYANKKLAEKNLDCIAANDVSAKGCGFASTTNSIDLIFKDGSIKKFPHAEKAKIAKEMIDFFSSHFF